MNRFKLFSLAIALVVVGILLGQNRELISLRLFCPNPNEQGCLYQSSEIPLAAWMAIFAIAGIVSSLIGHFLNQLATANGGTPSVDNYRSQNKTVNHRQTVEYTRRPQTQVKPPRSTSTQSYSSDWEEPRSEDWESSASSKASQDRATDGSRDPVDDSGNSEPQDTNRSHDSTYSYQSRKAKKESGEKLSDAQNNNVDRVYDATYRTIHPPQSTEQSVDPEEEEWI